MRNLRKSLAQSPRAWIVGAIAALLIAVLMQQALAEQLGGWLAGLWFGVVELVLKLLAPLFGG